MAQPVRFAVRMKSSTVSEVGDQHSKNPTAQRAACVITDDTRGRAAVFAGIDIIGSAGSAEYGAANGPITGCNVSEFHGFFCTLQHGVG